MKDALLLAFISDTSGLLGYLSTLDVAAEYGTINEWKDGLTKYVERVQVTIKAAIECEQAKGEVKT